MKPVADRTPCPACGAALEWAGMTHDGRVWAVCRRQAWSSRPCGIEWSFGFLRSDDQAPRRIVRRGAA